MIGVSVGMFTLLWADGKLAVILTSASSAVARGRVVWRHTLNFRILALSGQLKTKK